MTGPEAKYAAMTSGDLSTVRATEQAIHDAMSSVRDNVDLIRYAADKPDWSSPGARTRFNMSAWTSRAAADVCFIRLNRAKLAVGSAGDSYRWMDDNAAKVIEHWRTHKKLLTDPTSLLLLRFVVMVELTAIEKVFRDQLAQARDFLETDPLSDEQQDWLESGLVRAMRRDLENGHYPGPIIPETLATGGDDEGWVPQGLGYDRKTGLLVQTSYQNTDDDAEGDGAQLSLIDPDTGRLVQTVQLGPGRELPVPDHAGGVAVHDGTVWVTSSGKPGHVYPYSMEDIRKSRPGDVVPVRGEPQEVLGSAYSTIAGNTMYVGTFVKDGPGALHTYTWDRGSSRWVHRAGPVDTPPQTQGVAVRDGDIVFTTSYGRDNAGAMHSYDLASVLDGRLGEPRETVTLPNMAEGVARLPSGLATTYESGAATYADPQGSPLEELWAAMNMTVTPYGAMGMAAGRIDVEPATLREASKLFDEAEAGLTSVRTEVAQLRLPPGSLGEVDGATEFAVAVTRHCDTTASWLRRGTLATGVTASGLVATANDYEGTDSANGGLFGLLRGLLS